LLGWVGATPVGVSVVFRQSYWLIAGDTPDAFARNAQSEAKTWSQTVAHGKLAVH